jgi:hypothetical protein
MRDSQEVRHRVRWIGEVLGFEAMERKSSIAVVNSERARWGDVEESWFPRNSWACC